MRVLFAVSNSPQGFNGIAAKNLGINQGELGRRLSSMSLFRACSQRLFYRVLNKIAPKLPITNVAIKALL